MPCRTIAVANQKGGTGKTATTLSLGMALAKSGQRVLLVDTDPQGDLTKSLGWKDPDALGTTIANHLNATIEGASLDPREGILPHEEGIDLMPANIELAGMEMPILMAMSREQLVNMWMSPLKADYDFIIFDCAPTLGIIPINAFVASDSVLVPVSAEYLPASAMTGLLKTVGRVRRQINPSLEVEGILLTLFDSRNNLAREVEETIREQYGSAYRVFDTVIPRAVSAAEAPSVGASIFAYDGRGKVASALPRRWSAVGRKKVPITLPGVDDLFTSQGERDGSAVGGVADIPLALIDPLPGHPFQVRDDEEMERLAESIAENGVLVPLTVRGAGAERYELVSGHRRKCAAELAGLESVPCIVRTMSDDEAVIAMVDSNLQREAILPSERAFAYSMRLEAMKRQGQRTDLTCAQLAHKSDGRRSRDILAEELGVSKDKVQRFIRLTRLAPELLALVDEGRMKMLPAVEVSHLSQEEQVWLLDAMEAQACTPSHAQAVKMKRYSKEGSLTSALVRSIMEEEKPNRVEQVKIPRKSIARFFKSSATKDEIESRIVRALELLEQAEARRDRQGGA
jgi:ParB/RepB/Spo0J family partition protein